MSLEIIHTVWDELKTYLTPADRAAAAETLVDVLVHHDYELQALIEEFSRDAFLRGAIMQYADELVEHPDEIEEEDEDEDEEDY